MTTFLTVCRVMNYTKAAEELHITQPAVSQHIHFLETHYGVKLFRYEGKSLRLTEAGRMLRNAATTIRHDEMLLAEQMKTSARMRFSFGATRTIGDYVLPEKLARYVLKNPDADVRMLVDKTETLLQKINAGELDCALIEGYFQKAEFESSVYSRERCIAVCGGEQPAGRQPAGLADLFRERLILREPGSGTREVLERHLKERNCSVLDFAQVIEIGSIKAIKSLAAAGCGITFLYEASVQKELASGTLREIPLADFEVYNYFNWVWRKNSLFGDRVLRIAGEILGERDPAGSGTEPDAF